MSTKSPLFNEPSYDPNRLLDQVLLTLSLKNDAALSRSLGVGPAVLSKIRHRRLPVPAMLVIQIHEATAMTIDEIRSLMGAPGFERPNYSATGRPSWR